MRFDRRDNNYTQMVKDDLVEYDLAVCHESYYNQVPDFYNNPKCLFRVGGKNVIKHLRNISKTAIHPLNMKNSMIDVCGLSLKNFYDVGEDDIWIKKYERSGFEMLGENGVFTFGKLEDAVFTVFKKISNVTTALFTGKMAINRIERDEITVEINNLFDKAVDIDSSELKTDQYDGWFTGRLSQAIQYFENKTGLKVSGNKGDLVNSKRYRDTLTVDNIVAPASVENQEVNERITGTYQLSETLCAIVTSKCIYKGSPDNRHWRRRNWITLFDYTEIDNIIITEMGRIETLQSDILDRESIVENMYMVGGEIYVILSESVVNNTRRYDETGTVRIYNYNLENDIFTLVETIENVVVKRWNETVNNDSLSDNNIPPAQDSRSFWTKRLDVLSAVQVIYPVDITPFNRVIYDAQIPYASAFLIPGSEEVFSCSSQKTNIDLNYSSISGIRIGYEGSIWIDYNGTFRTGKDLFNCFGKYDMVEPQLPERKYIQVEESKRYPFFNSDIAHNSFMYKNGFVYYQKKLTATEIMAIYEEGGSYETDFSDFYKKRFDGFLYQIIEKNLSNGTIRVLKETDMYMTSIDTNGTYIAYTLVAPLLLSEKKIIYQNLGDLSFTETELESYESTGGVIDLWDSFKRERTPYGAMVDGAGNYYVVNFLENYSNQNAKKTWLYKNGIKFFNLENYNVNKPKIVNDELMFFGVENTSKQVYIYNESAGQMELESTNTAAMQEVGSDFFVGTTATHVSFSHSFLTGFDNFFIELLDGSNHNPLQLMMYMAEFGRRSFHYDVFSRAFLSNYEDFENMQVVFFETENFIDFQELKEFSPQKVSYQTYPFPSEIPVELEQGNVDENSYEGEIELNYTIQGLLNDVALDLNIEFLSSDQFSWEIISNSEDLNGLFGTAPQLSPMVLNREWRETSIQVTSDFAITIRFYNLELAAVTENLVNNLKEGDTFSFYITNRELKSNKSNTTAVYPDGKNDVNIDNIFINPKVINVISQENNYFYNMPRKIYTAIVPFVIDVDTFPFIANINYSPFLIESKEFYVFDGELNYENKQTILNLIER